MLSGAHSPNLGVEYFTPQIWGYGLSGFSQNSSEILVKVYQNSSEILVKIKGALWAGAFWNFPRLPFAITDPGEYICPSSLERASFCLASSSWLQCAVIAAYLHLLLAARRLCRGHVGSEERCRRCSRGLVWVIWTGVLLILSLLGCIVMATKSVPDFLSLPSSWLNALSLCVGGWQGAFKGSASWKGFLEGTL